MDELGGFEPTDTTGFIQIESIRIKKFVGFPPLSATLLIFISSQVGTSQHPQRTSRCCTQRCLRQPNLNENLGNKTILSVKNVFIVMGSNISITHFSTISNVSSNSTLPNLLST